MFPLARSRRLARTTLAWFVLVGCSSRGAPTVGSGDAGTLPPGAHTLTLVHDGMDRLYRLHVPPGAERAGPLPVLLAFHGGGGNAGQFERSSNLPELAGEEGFLLVFPDGTGFGPLHTWNAGGCCGGAAERGVDDVGFVSAVLDHLSLRGRWTLRGSTPPAIPTAE